MPTFSPFRVVVPASTANLGPGFDIFGLALSLYNRFDVLPGETGNLSIEATGSGAELLPTDESNLFYQVVRDVLADNGVQLPPVKIRIHLEIPPTRGFGSSATAIVGGLLSANHLLGNKLDQSTLVDLAVKLEKGQHPDNVTASLYGGMLINVVDQQGKLITTRIPFPEALKAVCFIPDFEMDTVKGRQLMPTSYTREDVIFTTSRVALLLAALQRGRFDWLRSATEDRLHQPYRSQIFPGMPQLIQSALDAGAHGAFLSGGGPTILALASENFGVIAAAMEDTASQLTIPGHSQVLSVEPHGAEVQVLQTEATNLN